MDFIPENPIAYGSVQTFDNAEKPPNYPCASSAS